MASTTRATPDLRIAVTGASGWVGQSILAYLHRKLGPDRFYTCVFPFSSVSRRLNLNFSIDPIQSYPLAEMPARAEEAPFDFVFHAAFFVRDHLSSSDLDDYILANRMITGFSAENAESIGPQSLYLCHGCGPASDVGRPESGLWC